MAPLGSQGLDTGKMVAGRKRHILVDTLALLPNVAIRSPSIQNHDGVALVLNPRICGLFSLMELICSDGGCQGLKSAAATVKTSA